MYVFVSMLVIGQHIILPIIYATILAISISPMVDLLVKKKVNHALAIGGILMVSVFLVGTLVILITSQTSLLCDAWPQLTGKLDELYNKSVLWISNYSNISVPKINEWLDDGKTELMNNKGAAIGMTMTTISGIMSAALLTPVYIFMILFYQPHLIKFVHKIFGDGHNKRVSEVLSQTKSIIQNYLAGLFTEFIIILVLNSIGLLMLGIDYAILLGVVGALLNVIPYVGGIIGVALFIIIAGVTKPPIYVLYVIILYTIIQLIDNHYIVPKIIGSKVKLNALVSLIAVLVGEALWGIPGMFLSIPLTAIIKLILDRVESLKPLGFLLGDTSTPMLKINLKEISKIIPNIINP
jgi:predicted PurR-regulated permease PerM